MQTQLPILPLRPATDGDNNNGIYNDSAANTGRRKVCRKLPTPPGTP